MCRADDLVLQARKRKAQHLVNKGEKKNNSVIRWSTVLAARDLTAGCDTVARVIVCTEL